MITIYLSNKLLKIDLKEWNSSKEKFSPQINKSQSELNKYINRSQSELTNAVFDLVWDDSIGPSSISDRSV